MIVYTTAVDRATEDWFQDVYNFELILRLVPNKEKVLNARSFHDKVRHLINYLFTTYVVNRENGSNNWSPPKWTYNEYGKPMLPDLHTSSSSSNDIIALVTSDTNVGIDLSHKQQNIHPGTVLEDFQSIFDPRELEQLRRIEDQHSRYIAFNQIWTLKEAFTKYIGTGLNVDLSLFWFDVKGKWAFAHQGWNTDILVHSSYGTLYACSASLTNDELPVIVSVVSPQQAAPLLEHVPMVPLLQQHLDALEPV